MPERTGNFTYSQAGVDVGIEAEAARILFRASKKTWDNRLGELGEVVVPDDNFSGLRYIRAAGLPKGTVFFAGSDGVATKIEAAERLNKYDTLGFDLIAMVCDDAVAKGAEPIAVTTILAVNTLGRDERRLPYIEELCVGYVAAANEAGVAIINGEIAQHNDRMGQMKRLKLDWSGTCIWFGNESRMIEGDKVSSGDFLVGLENDNPRCNGISLLRKRFKKVHGKNWHEVMLGEKSLGQHILTPSRIYSRAIVDMVGGWSLDRPAKVELHGIAHISGGGIKEKLGRTLRPSGLGAYIYDPFTPPEVMRYCQELGVTDEEAYGTWNMGQGMILITPDVNNAIRVAREHDIRAKVIGKITKKPGIVIESKGKEERTVIY